MAAGEYVSVHSQKDTEDADLALERRELRADDIGEHKELAAIYVGRGLDPVLAKKVADQLMARDALGAHARDELGITPTLEARPIQAALASAASFIFGSSHTLDCRGLGPGGESPDRSPGVVAAGAGVSGGAGCADGRRADGARRHTGRLLGRAGDGRHRRRRRFVRHGCLRSNHCVRPLPRF